MSGTSGTAERRAALLVFCLSLLAYGYFVYRGPHHNPDSRLALTYSLVERRSLAIDAYAETTLDRAYVGGHYYTDKAPGVSFVVAPLYALFRTVLPPALLDLGTAEAPDRFVVRYLLTFFGIGVSSALFNAALFGWLGRIERSVGPRLAVTLGYALGSPVYPFSVSAFGHVPAAICLGTAFMLAAVAPQRLAARRLAGAGALLGLAIGFEYPTAVVGLVVAALAVVRAAARRRAAPWLAVGATGPLLMLGAYHWAAFGSPVTVGYAHLAPCTEYAAAQASGFLGVRPPDPRTTFELLFGGHRGLFVFAPWLALALPGSLLLWRRKGWRPAVIAGVAGFALLLAVNSGYALWDGGASWGPRHLVPALPLLTVMALPAAARWPRIAWALAGVSVAVTLVGVAIGGLPDSEVARPLTDLVWPRALAGGVTNNWGQLLGLAAWRGLVPLLACAAVLVAYAAGWRRSSGGLTLALWTLLAVAVLDRAYLEYSEGYYFYLGSRLATGARLYADAASTQPPLLPLLVSALWRVRPDVWLPRLTALGCYAAAALLAGRLAARLTDARWAGPVATALAAVLPLGAGGPQVLEANAVLAPMAPLLALLWLEAERAHRTRRRWLALGAGLAASVGLATKLTFLPFALVPFAVMAARVTFGRDEVGRGRDDEGLVRRGPLSVYALALLAGAGAQLIGWWVASGPQIVDGLTGELESPLLPAGALLAFWQWVWLEGVPLAAAVGGWIVLRGRGKSRAALWFGLAAVALPAFGVHQGTFVGAARPAEPFVAAFAIVFAEWSLGELRRRLSRRAAASAAWSAGLVALGAGPFWHSATQLLAPHTVAPETVLTDLALVAPGDEVLVPPYYAALAGRRMWFDYADWTVWGMRAAVGVPRERALADAAAADLRRRRAPVVMADFRLRYIADVDEALRAAYVPAGSDGDVPVRSVTFWRPR